MTPKAVRLFLGSFAIACILIGLLAGFLLVDLSTDRYMPGTFDPIFLVSGIDEQGIEVALLGESYRLDNAAAQEVQAVLWNWRGLLPREIRLAGALGARIAGLFA